MENPTLIRASLSDVKVIMTIMHVLVVKLLCQTAAERIPALECLLPGACGPLWPCLILSGIK
jgi:hypothetical protein